MIVITLQSGSSGNSIYVESGDTRLLFDAGISGVQAQKRLAMHGRDIRDVDALVISHDHADHVSSAGVFSRKYGIPVHISAPTYEAAMDNTGLGNITSLTHFSPGHTLDFREIKVETLPTAHDAIDGAAFVVKDTRGRLGILTDLGHAFEGLGRVIESLDAVLIESNYDPVMLERGPYPAFVKNRIRGDGGHLSNGEAAELLREHGKKLQWACLAHLSENNNNPATAITRHHRILGERFPIYTASHRACSEVFTL